MSFRRMTHSLLVVALPMLALCASQVFAQGAGRARVQEGNQLYLEGKFDQANNAYRDAKLDNPTSPVIDYNLANTLYQKKQYEEAIKLYDDILKRADDPSLLAKVHYNTGNALFQLNKLPESILAYKDALKINPDDEDAKYNLELVRARLKQESEKQQQEQQQNPDQQKIEPSEYAKKLKARAEGLVAQRRYPEALALMEEGLKIDQTVAAFQDFIQRLKNVVDIESR